MSKEYSPAGAAVKAVLGTAVGMGLGVVVTTTALLLAEHLKRKMDKGLVHLPWSDKPLWLGDPPPESLRPVEPRPPAQRPVENAQPAPTPVLNLSGLVDLMPEVPPPGTLQPYRPPEGYR